MLSKEEIKKIIDTNINIITYKTDKDYRCLNSTEATLLENNKKIEDYAENSICIQEIEEKQKELQKQYEEALEENSTKAFILKSQIAILQELIK